MCKDARGEGRYPLPGLAGAHQVENAALATVCARLLPGFDVGGAAIAQGLVQARWPGRLQRIAWLGLDDGWELWVDGGHNEAAAIALGRVAEGWADRPLDLVVGMLNTRPPKDFLRPLATLRAPGGGGADSRSGRERDARRHPGGCERPWHLL